MFDVIIRGGFVADGTGAPPWRADVGIIRGIVAAVGRLGDAQAGEVLQAAGRIVMPGFVDAHSHADARVLDDEVQLALLRQGVTTIVTGQDGVSFAPGSADAAAWAGEYFAGINGPADPAWARGGLSLGEYRALLDGRARVNTAHLLPHGTLRYHVAGLQTQLDGGQLRELVRRVETGLADGACGMSTGLHYVPGLYARADELCAVSEPLAAAERPYVTHMRGYEAEARIGMDEVHQIGVRSGAAVHVSHYHGPANMLIELVKQAREASVDVTFDSYPYMSGLTLLTLPLLPADLQQLPPQALVDQLGDADVARRLRDEWFPRIADVFDRATIAGAPADGYRDAEGLTVAQAAAAAGEDPGVFVIELLRATRAAVTAVFARSTTTEADVRALLRHEAHMGGSDGIFVGGRPHPRAWGTFARFLARHTRELADWTWGEASLHLAGHPARRFGLAERGLLRPGAVADIVVVNPEWVQDVATYPDPAQLAVGIDDVWVNGQRVLRDGRLTAALAGRALSPGA